MMRRAWLLLLCFSPLLASAAGPGLPALTVQNAAGGQTYTLTIQLLALMTAITLLPAALLMMTAFTRIIIVLSILRQAIGAGQSPPNQVLIGLALFLTMFVMSPVIDKIRTDAVNPYMAGTIEASVALDRGVAPLKMFMLQQTREADIAAFVRISGGNLAFTAEIYERAGGFPRIAIEDEHDDLVLVDRIRKLTPHYALRRDARVQTSLRRNRAYGFVNTMRWYGGHRYRPKLVDVR